MEKEKLRGACAKLAEGLRLLGDAAVLLGEAIDEAEAPSPEKKPRKAEGPAAKPAAFEAPCSIGNAVVFVTYRGGGKWRFRLSPMVEGTLGRTFELDAGGASNYLKNKAAPKALANAFGIHDLKPGETAYKKAVSAIVRSMGAAERLAGEAR
jgi:hypothetical protein